MSLEIERRFLIQNDNWKKYIQNSFAIEQGYLSSSSEWIVRIRYEKDKYILTLKKHLHNFSNHEFEYEIPFIEGQFIMSNVDLKITKMRYNLLVNKKEWVIDCFKDKNFPLKIAEIELQNENEEIQLPDFLSKEISGIQEFSNFELSKNPFEIWKKNKLKDFLNH